MSRRDWPENAGKFAPWTLDLATLSASAVPPSFDAAEGEYPASAFDARRCRGFCVQVVPGTVVGAACSIELQGSIDGIHYVSLGAAYQLAVPAGAPSPSSMFLVSNPWYQFFKVVTIVVATSGSANIFFAARD